MPAGHTHGKRSRCGDLLRLERLPRLRSGYVLRDKFTLSSRGLPRVTGVFAPPGFGKTQLLAFWYYELRSRGHDVVWVDGASPDADDRLRARKAAKANEPLAIFIDNADAGPLQQSLSRLTGATGRTDLLFLAGRRACLPEAEFDRRFGPDDLRFGEEEARAFLQERMACACPDAITETITRCAGVPALLNISVAEFRDSPIPKSSATRIHGGFFAAYVRDCLSHLSEDELSLLEHIAVPDRFCIELAICLTGRSDCGAIIDRLRHDLPFFLPSTGPHHALLPAFREVILNGRRGKAGLLSAHRAAARWFADRNRHGEAVDHAVAAGDVELGINLMSEHLLEAVMTGELERVLGWLAAIPRERILKDPNLCFAVALAYLLAGEAELTNWLRGQFSRDHRTIVLACHFALKERGDAVETLLGRIGSVDDLSPVAAACYSNLYRSVHQRHERWRAVKALTPPPPVQSFRSIRAIGVLLEAERLSAIGKASHAIATIEPLAQDCEAQLGNSSSVTNMLAISLASACFQTGDVDRADQLLAGRLDGACRHNFPTVPCNALLTAARIEAIRGNPSACLDLLERLEALGIERNLLRLCATAQAERVRIYALTRQQMLASITLTALEKTQESVRATTPFHSGQVDLKMLLARAHFLQSLGKNREARPVLASAEALACRLGRTLEHAEAIILRGEGHSSKTLEQSLAVLAIDDADRRALLFRLRGETCADPVAPVADAAPPRPDFDILGPPVLVRMTDREIRILEGLSRDLSNKAIARELQLSNETVKWYIGKILAKLGAHDRREAVDRARTFGVLPMFRAQPWRQNFPATKAAPVSLSYGSS